jgi:uncharacterized protein involved in exopolysaccharide biosynthesis
MSNPDPLPEDRMPVRTPGLADALRRLAANPSLAHSSRRPFSSFRSVEMVEARARDVFSVIRRQSRLFAAVFAALAVVLGLMVLIQTPQFESTALLLVKVGRELLYNPEVGDQKTMTPSPRDKQTVINSELSIMRSEPVIASVVDSVGLANLYPDLGEALAEAQGDADAEQTAAVLKAKAGEQLREALVVLALPESDVLQVSFRHPDGAIAQKTVATLIDRFTEAHLHAFGEPEVARFLEARVKAFRESLATAEAAQREFELAHPIFADESPPSALTKRLEELRAQIDAINLQINQVHLATVGENSALGQAERERLALEVEASQVVGHLRQDAENRIAVVRQFIATRKGEIDGQIGSLQQRRDQLSAQLNESERERAQLPALASRYADLRRERDANEEQFNIYQKRLRDARFSHEMDTEKIASISVIQKATLAPEAIWPLPPALGIVVVLVLSSLVAGLAATLADHYRWTWPGTWRTPPNMMPIRDEILRLAQHARQQARRR